MGQRKVYILMSISTFFWAGSFIAAKYSAPYIPTFALVFFRFAIAAIVLKAALSMLPLSKDYTIQKSDRKFILATGAFGMFGYHVLFFLALLYTSATNASIIAAMNPIFTVIIGIVFAKQFVSRNSVIGIVVSFLGVVLTITGAQMEVLRQLSFNIGDLLMFIGMAGWSYYMVLCNKSSVPPVYLTYYHFTIAALLALPFMLAEKPWVWMASAPVAAWLSVVYMAVCPSVFCVCVLQVGMRVIGAQRSSIFTNLVPGISMLLAALLLGETFQLTKLFTMLLVVAGVFICQTGKQKKKEETL